MKSKYEENIALNLDDSSDEEDNYQDHHDLRKAIESFIQQNLNIDKDTVTTAFILEDQGRRIIYNQATRQKYYEAKRRLLSYDEKLAEEIKKLPFEEILEESVNKVAKRLNPGADYATLIKECLAKIIPREKLISATLKQSNKEFLIDELERNFAPLLEILSGERARIGNQIVNQDEYKITSEKLTKIGAIKNNLEKEVEKKLKLLNEFYHDNEEKKDDGYKAKIKEVLGISYNHADFPDSVEKSITETPYKKPHGITLNFFIKKTLQTEINTYLSDGFIDKKKIGTDIKDSKFLTAVLEQSQNEGYISVTSCTNAMFQAAQHHTPEFYSEKTRNDFGLFLSCILKEDIELNIERRTLKTTYADPKKIEDTNDFYAKEHLLYRSAVRQSRNNVKKEIARTVVFDDEQDLSVQKWQDIKSQGEATVKHISNRGTLQEEVYNLGNYEKVLEKIQSFSTSDQNMATRIRAIYKNGLSALDNIKSTNLEGQKVPLSQLLNKEQKQTLIELVELFFGTEAFRSPSVIVETNMALDLIKDGHKTWKELLTGKATIGKGGDLSFSMKSAEGAGGIESGRQLSEDVNQHHGRMHKYGGEPIDRNSVGYKEYLSRKKEISYSWVEKVGKEDPKALSVQQKVDMIRTKDKDWYKGV